MQRFTQSRLMLQIAKQYLTEKHNELFQEAKVGTNSVSVHLSEQSQFTLQGNRSSKVSIIKETHLAKYI